VRDIEFDFAMHFTILISGAAMNSLKQTIIGDIAEIPDF
jgi:hypothetical protein